MGTRGERMTKIEWTDRTWNPLIGCTRISEGCRNCYAERFVHRGMQPSHRGLTVKSPGKAPRWNGEVTIAASRLSMPFHWRRPQRIFTPSLSDLWHPEVPFEYVAAVFGVMRACHWHTFQVLTKRTGRARAWFAWLQREANDRWMGIGDYLSRCARQWMATFVDWSDLDKMLTIDPAARVGFPLWNVWLMTSVEDRKSARARLPDLLKCPAELHGISYEPALEDAVDEIRPYLGDSEWSEDHGGRPGDMTEQGIQWVVMGGESGHGARGYRLAIADRMRDACADAEVAFFHKQVGACPIVERPSEWPTGRVVGEAAGGHELRLRDRKGGAWTEWPPAYRVREFPRYRWLQS